MTPREFADAVRELIMTRKGEVITEELASERANNIAAAFGDLLGWIPANRGGRCADCSHDHDKHDEVGACSTAHCICRGWTA